MSSDRKCIVVSAPSGAGKTTLVRYLLQQDLQLAFSVSATSRPPREYEKDGIHYHFLTQAEFEQAIRDGRFIEWEEVYEGKYYGTLRDSVEATWTSGNHVIFDVDVIGGLNLKEQFGDRALAIFIEAPSIEDLETRLRARGTENESMLRTRVEKAKLEMKRAPEFDVRIVNDDLETACIELERVVKEFLDR